MSVRTARLAEAASFIRGITFKPEDVLELPSHESVVCFRTKNVQIDLDTTDLLHLPSEFVKREEQFVCKGDMLVSSANSWNLVGKTAWVPELNYRATAGGFISILRPRANVIYPRYLYHWITEPSTQEQLRDCGRQTTNISNLDLNRALELTLPLPPLEEQERIAAILDKADAIRRKRQEALRLTEDFLRSTFLDLFGDPVGNPKGFPRGTIRDLVESANYGTSVKAHPTDGEYPVLRMNNITYSGGWDFSSLKYVDLESSSAPKYLVSKGQMLFNRTNSKELVGKTAVYRQELPMAYAGYLVRVTARPDADAEYISAYLNSSHGKAILLGMCKSIVGMANINAQEMLSIPILLPPERLQKSFGDIVRLVETRRESQRQAIEVSNILFASLQQRGFSGKL